MSLIDWSDPDEMLGLLVDYVADEANATRADRGRSGFLEALLEDLRELADDGGDTAGRLRDIRASQPEEFSSDPVIGHLDACIEELDRIEGSSH